MEGYTYGDLIQDMTQTMLLLAALDEVPGFEGRRWTVADLQYEIDYLSRHTDPDEEVN